MKVVIINTSELNGGAAVAANRLSNALRKAGVKASMLVRDQRTDDPMTVSINNSFLSKKINYIRFIWERFIIFLCNRLNKKNLFQVSIANTGIDLTKHPLVEQADIIHIHWINQGLLSINGLERLCQIGKPIVWTLHDLWPATAICHYPGDCALYTTTCHDCPLMQKNSLFDLASSVFKKKRKIGLFKITFVGCSQWIMNAAMKGAWLKKAQFTSIPNPIDISIFTPEDRLQARKSFGLPENKYLLLFAAAKLSDTRKGAIFLIDACERLHDRYRDQIEIVLMGNSSEELIHKFPFKVNTVGYIPDQSSMVTIYSSVDMFIIPSLEDNLPNTIMESMACGTPCVGFQTGGIPEMIDHKQNGYIARYRDPGDLASGIEWVLEKQLSLELQKKCIDKVHTYYQECVVANQYINLYNSLLDKK